jgi:predicted MPP superfamily phosphohydrolase
METVKRLNEQRMADRQLRFQYIFSGHTHGEQVRFSNLIPFLPRGSAGYVNGWYKREKPYIYISKGFSTSAIPLRFGARPRMTVFEYGE